jgi:ABC-type polysaccharide/polyol phosphate transport system ATPase subunit
MQSDIAISFREVSKCYKGRNRVASFLDKIKNGQLGKRLMKDNGFYALQNVSFTIRKGEHIGIIGHNGAGKSTLLKLMAKTTWPSTGTVEIQGTIGGILELGAGFHPDLTGRENVFLSGAMYGYGKKEIEALLTEICDIAEVGSFFDIPIKKYSSGMKVKLAFAMAMTTKPDIVLLDEAFAVGDARYNKKSSELMKSYVKGKTVILVSHNSKLISDNCDRVIVMDHGKMAFDGNVSDGMKLYRKLVEQSSTPLKSEVHQPKLRRGVAEDPLVNVIEFKPLFMEEELYTGDSMLSQLQFYIHLDVEKVKKDLSISVVFQRKILSGIPMTLDEYQIQHSIRGKGLYEYTLSVDGSQLKVGEYLVSLQVQSDSSRSLVKKTLEFQIQGDERSAGIVDLGIDIKPGS